jgi:hypothetical protein
MIKLVGSGTAAGGAPGFGGLEVKVPLPDADTGVGGLVVTVALLGQGGDAPSTSSPPTLLS